MKQSELDRIWDALNPYAQIDFQQWSQDLWNRGYHSNDPDHYAKVLAYNHWLANKDKPKAE